MRDHLRFQRAYNTKKDADDRPMSMWISRTEQLSEARELLGELVWAFMNEIWPSTVSCVIPKGEQCKLLQYAKLCSVCCEQGGEVLVDKETFFRLVKLFIPGEHSTLD